MKYRGVSKRASLVPLKSPASEPPGRRRLRPLRMMKTMTAIDTTATAQVYQSMPLRSMPRNWVGISLTVAA